MHTFFLGGEGKGYTINDAGLPNLGEVHEFLTAKTERFTAHHSICVQND
jgi:hypothetical protein